MLYRAIGLMSGSSLDGLDIVYAEFHENAGRWAYEIMDAACYPYPGDWKSRLAGSVSLNARDYQLLHCEYGHYLGEQVNRFIREHNLLYQVSLIASHGHTTFHLPPKMTAQLGDGASIASETQLPVVTDLRALDVAFGGQGAPIVPIGEKLLLSDYDFFLNIGGIANVSINTGSYTAFDVCAANRVLNMLAADMGKQMDEGGRHAESGNMNDLLLEELNNLEYYKRPHPKTLANDFGTDLVYPLIKKAELSIQDALRTYVEHIAIQVRNAIAGFTVKNSVTKLLTTGGGAHNTFLTGRLQALLRELNVEIVVPGDKLIDFKEALIMAFIGVLRWRQEYNVLASVTGASRDSIGGALWIGQEA